MKKFEWNNFLHIKIQQFFYTIFEIAKQQYKLNVLKKCEILNHIIDLMSQNDFLMPS